MPTTILIVDDHDGFRARAARALEADGFSVVGHAGDLASGLREVTRLQPAVVLLDIHLPDGSGVEAAAAFTKAAPRTRVILISTYDAQDLTPIGDGVVGFLPKSELSGQAVAALIGGGSTPAR